MAEYINRNELVENLDRFAPEHLTPLIKTLIEKQPTADVVEVRHGKWITSTFKEPPKIEGGRLYERKHTVYECSECKVKIVGLSHMWWCPNCGAKMCGKEEVAYGKDKIKG